MQPLSAHLDLPFTRGLESGADVLGPLARALKIPRLSDCVTQEVFTLSCYFGTQLERLICDSFPYLQRFLFHSRPTQYEAIAAYVEPLLPDFRWDFRHVCQMTVVLVT